ncbi:MAG TPA: response regulator [bacterium]|nr:response regulator [bacterium]
MSQRILVVEDSPTMRQLISFSLRALPKLKIIEAIDGLDGLKKIQSEAFDLAVIDINMPLMDGLKLINLIRQDPKNKTIPVVIISTEGGAETKKRAEALGVDAYITKPIMAGHVLATIRGLLEKKAGPAG